MKPVPSGVMALLLFCAGAAPAWAEQSTRSNDANLALCASAGHANVPIADCLLHADALIKLSKFAQAKDLMTAYLSAHPADSAALNLLGVADEYLNNSQGAVAAFDQASKIQDRFKPVAAKAYADAAVEALKAKDSPLAVKLGNKALAIRADVGTVNTLFIVGTAYANSQQFPAAIATLEKAKAKATAGHANAATRNAIDASLATAYIFGGRPTRGMAIAAALKRRDPGNTRVDDTLAAYYNQQAVREMKAGHPDLAVATLEAAARTVHSRAIVLYEQAANVMSQGNAPDWLAVKREADKALAIDGNDARGNLIAGIALANGGNKSTAIKYLLRAKANAPDSDAALQAEIASALKTLQQ